MPIENGVLVASLKMRGRTAAELTAENPTLLDREFGVETDTYTEDAGVRVYKLKFGPGQWNTLPYAAMGANGMDAAAVNALIAAHVAAADPHGDRAYTNAQISALGTAAQADTGTAAGNVPVLDGSGILPVSILPALAITDTYEVASQVAMLALTAERGDIAIRTDLNKCFVLAAEPASTLSNWKELKTPADAVLAVAGLTGAITAHDMKSALAIAVSDIAAIGDQRLLGNVSGGTMAPAELTPAQVAAMLPVMVGDTGSGGTKGLVPAPAAGDAAAAKMLRADGTWAAVPAPSPLTTINAQTGTSYTLALTDGGPDKMLTQSNAAAITTTVPNNSSVAFPIGTVISGTQTGAGRVTISPASGVTITSRDSCYRTMGTGSPWTLLKTATNTWLLWGDLIL